MKSRTRVVVIGGGIAGCSTLFHLGELIPVEVIAAGPYDPSHKRLQT